MVYLMFSRLLGNHGLCVVMATYVIIIAEFYRNLKVFCILKRQKYFHGNKEGSEKTLILAFFKRYNYVMSLSPVFTENGPYKQAFFQNLYS